MQGKHPRQIITDDPLVAPAPPPLTRSYLLSPPAFEALTVLREERSPLPTHPPSALFSIPIRVAREGELPGDVVGILGPWDDVRLGHAVDAESFVVIRKGAA